MRVQTEKRMCGTTMAETEQSAADTQQVAGETANERILHALRESEQRFRALVSAGAYTIYRMSPDWRQMYEVEGEDFSIRKLRRDVRRVAHGREYFPAARRQARGDAQAEAR